MRIVVLGAGFGGLELSSRLSLELGDAADVVLIDKADGFVFGFSKLDVMFGRRVGRQRASIPTATSCKPGVRFVAGRRSARSTRTRSGSRPTPAPSTPTSSWWRSAPISTRRRRPAWSRAATSSTRVAGAFALRDVLADFAGGRVDRRRHLDAVQVPAGAERDRAAAARLPDRARSARHSDDRSGDAARACRSRRRRPRRRRCWRRSPSAASPGIPSSWSVRWTRRARSPSSPTVASCLTTCSSGSRCHRVPAVVERVGAVRRRLDPGRLR